MDGGGAEDGSWMSWVELWLKEGLAADTHTHMHQFRDHMATQPRVLCRWPRAVSVS